jgi:hypothetical protein
MADIVIRTNNVPRDFVDAWELSQKERAEFDYIDWQAIEDGRDSATFFRYKGVLYDLGEFLRLHDNGRVQMARGDSPFASWDGYMSDSFFSGLVIRLVDNGERCIVGRYCA